MKHINDFQLTRNFNLKEFEDHYTHEVKISQKLVNNLQYLRNVVGPLKISSGYRTLETNKRVDGHKRSLHMEGKAVDIVRTRNTFYSISRIATEAKMFKFKRIIKYAKHIHLAVS